MEKPEIIEYLILESVGDMNDQLPDEQQLDLSTKTALYGRDGKIDSLGLVNLIVAVEEKVQDKFGITITLADERAMSQKCSPFTTIASLVDYIEMLIKEKNNA